MKQLLTRMTAFAAAVMISAACLAGCGSAIGKSDYDKTAVVLDGEKYSFAEAKLYIYASQYMIEQSSEYVIAYMYGDYEKFWEEENNGSTYYQMNYIEGLNKLFQTKRLLKKAAADGITLTADELAKVDAALLSFKEERASVVEAAECSDELLKQFLTENALANKTYLAMVADVDTSFDAETFRRKNEEGVYVTAKTEKPAAETEEASAEAEEGTEAEETAAEPYTEEEQKAAREAAAKDILARLEAGEAVTDIVSSYSDSETVNVFSTGALTIAPEDAAEEGAELTGYRQLAWTLSTGETGTIDVVSSSTSQTVTSYMIRCINDDDPDLRKSAEDSELATRKSTLFADRYKELCDLYSKYHVYDDVIATTKKVIPLYHSEMMNQVQGTQAAE